MTIHCITSEAQVLATFAQRLAQENIAVQLLHDARQPWSVPDWSHVERLVLFTPFFYENQYIAAEKVWQSWLKKTHPRVRFFTAGFCQSDIGVANHLDLMNLPKSLRDFFAQQSSDLSPATVDTEGLQLHHKLARFFDGHGKESIFDVLSDITRLIGMAVAGAQRHGDSFEIIREDFLQKLPAKWVELNNRWLNYYALLCCLPVADTLRETNALIAKVDQNYMGGICEQAELFQEETLLNLLNDIHKQLFKVRQTCL